MSRGGHKTDKQFQRFKRILKHSIHSVTAFLGCPLKKYSTPATTIIYNTKVYIQYYKILFTID
jgi:phage terminase Nu1 subunit (DNA packaging protein)